MVDRDNMMLFMELLGTWLISNCVRHWIGIWKNSLRNAWTLNLNIKIVDEMHKH